MKVSRSAALGVLIAAIVVIGAMAAVASGSAGSSTTTAATPVPPKITLPPSIVKKGRIDIALTIDYPPFEYLDAKGEPAGLDVDLVKAIAKVLKIKLNFIKVAFPTQIPGIANGRYDLNISQNSDTPARRQLVSFLDLHRAAIIPVVRKGNPTGLTATNMCGRTVSGGTGSAQTALLELMSTDCVKQGKEKIAILDFPELANQLQAVVSGRTEAFFVNPAVAAYVVKEAGGTIEPVNQTLPPIPGTKYTGWPLTRTPLTLAIALQKASIYLIKTGTWEKILKQWGASLSALPTPLINGS